MIKNVSLTNGSWKETVYYIFDEYVEVVNSSGTYAFTYIEHEGQRVAEVRNDSSVLYVAPDHLGSSQVIMNSSGSVIENSSFTPYGSIISGGNISRYDYTGQEYDNVIGDYDYNARRYKSEWGKFTKPDPLTSNAYDPQGLNEYSYTLNNPYIYIDSDGKKVTLVARGLGSKGGSIGVHTFLDITPDNPQDFSKEYQTTFILSGTEQGGNLVIVKDLESDRTPQRLKESITVPTPEGLTDTQFIEKIIKLYEDYGDFDKKVKYDPTSIFSYNSNDAASSLLRGSGVSSNFLKNFNPSGFNPGLGGYSSVISTVSLSSILVQQIAAKGGGYSTTLGAYISSDKKIYPTSNPNWKPKGDSKPKTSKTKKR